MVEQVQPVEAEVLESSEAPKVEEAPVKEPPVEKAESPVEEAAVEKSEAPEKASERESSDVETEEEDAAAAEPEAEPEEVPETQVNTFCKCKNNLFHVLKWTSFRNACVTLFSHIG